MKSIWQDTDGRPEFDRQHADIRTDTLIIGGGMAGLLCAHFLQQAGVPYVLAEADRICSGVTAGTTAKITLQHGFFADTLIRRFGYERARMYIEANRAAMDAWRQLCSGKACSYVQADNIVYTRRSGKAADDEATALNRLGVDAVLLDHLPVPQDCAGAVCVREQAQVHPLKAAFLLAQGLNICEHTRVLALQPGGALTEHGRIRADRIVVATHFPFLNKHGSYFMKMYQHRSYVLALRNAPPVSAMLVDEADTGLSFRQTGDVLLLGGGGHRTGKHGGGWAELRDYVRCNMPQAQEVAHWAAQDCMTLDSVPYIGQYSRSTPGLYVTTGFNKWGMTGSMAGAMILRDLLLGRKNDWAEVFSPSRTMLRPQLAVNMLETTAGMMKLSAPRCPHLGCALHYNRQEHSWDCPCHGSRFTEEGALLDNPATAGMKKKP